jgi:S1-C subfamily serine protease
LPASEWDQSACRFFGKRCQISVNPRGVSGAAFDPADRAGLRPGDIMTTISRRAIRSAADARRELGRAAAGEPIFVLVWRRGVDLFLQIRKD